MMTKTEWKDFERVEHLADAVDNHGVGFGNPPMDDQMARTILAAYRELKERREDEEWLKKHYADLIYRNDGAVSLHAAGIIGRAIGPTLHDAVDVARGGK